MEPQNLDRTRELLDELRAKKAVERSSAGKILRRFASSMKDYGYARRSTFFWRERGHIIQFIHVHKYSFGPCFRIHVCIRILNDARPSLALMGISSSEHQRYRNSIEFNESEESLEICVNEMKRYVAEVAEPWFESQTYAAILADETVAFAEERKGLAAALHGEANPVNIELSRSLFVKRKA
jgi:hypothetical protein